MSKKNKTEGGRGQSTFANTHSAVGTQTPKLTEDFEKISHQEYEANEGGLPLEMEMSFKHGKCSNSADLPSS